MPHSWRVSEADSESRPPFQSLDCWACSFSGDTHEARASKLKPGLPQHTDLKAQSLGRGWPPGCSDRTAEQLDHLQWDGAERRPQGQLSLSGLAQSTFPEMPQESKMGAHQHQMRQACSPPPQQGRPHTMKSPATTAPASWRRCAPLPPCRSSSPRAGPSRRDVLHQLPGRRGWRLPKAMFSLLLVNDRVLETCGQYLLREGGKVLCS